MAYNSDGEWGIGGGTQGDGGPDDTWERFAAMNAFRDSHPNQYIAGPGMFGGMRADPLASYFKEQFPQYNTWGDLIEGVQGTGAWSEDTSNFLGEPSRYDIYTPTSGQLSRMPEYNPATGWEEKFFQSLPFMIAGAGIADMGGFSSVFGGAEDLVNTGYGANSAALTDSFDPTSLMSGSEGTQMPSLYDDIQNFSTNYNPISSGAADFTSSLNPNAALGQEATTGLNYSTNPFSGFSEGGLASSISPTSLGGTAGTAATSGGGFMSGLQDIFKGLGTPLMQGTNLSPANIGSALANYFMQAQKQDQLNAAANKSAQLNDPMQQTARLPFQSAYANLMFNPDSYKSTPYAQGQQNMANQAFQANVSKYGPGGTQFSDYLKNFQNIQSNDFFKLADQFSTAGGFNQGTGGAGTAYGNLAGQAANAGPSAFEGFGKLFQPGATNTQIPGNFDFSTSYSPQNNPFSTGFSLS